MALIGWNKQEIQIQAKNLAMFGYGNWHHRAVATRSPLFARTIVIVQPEQADLILCCLDMGCITHAMREQVQQALSHEAWFDGQQLLLMATHTHSAPGGCGYEALYNMPTPGFVPEHVAAIACAVVQSIYTAKEQAAVTEVRVSQAHFDADTPVAWNRSIHAYNRNPDVVQRTEDETHLAVERTMDVFGFYRQDKLEALMSLFGVHATCLGNTLKQYSGDNKGYAAALSEDYLLSQGVKQPVAIFAQSLAGDISPHFHGKDQWQKRKQIRGEAEYAYAEQNGRYQSELALHALTQAIPLDISVVDTVYQYIDLNHIHIDAEFAFGQENACTSPACHGASFFAGAPVDGRGAAQPIVKAMQFLSKQLRKSHSNPQHPHYKKYQALYASQGVKAIVLETGNKRLLGRKLNMAPGFADPLIAEMNRQYKAGALKESEMVAHIVPIQLLRLGHIVLLCCPGEITTTAGKRLIATVQQQLGASYQVQLISYCNDYMGYITTYEEYQQQAYEGGHTLFGQWTLAAFQSKFKVLAQQLKMDKAQRQLDNGLIPKVPPQQELALRTNYGSHKTAVK